METQLSFFSQTKNIGLHGILAHKYFEMINPKVVTAFWNFHLDNPNVFELFVKFSRQLKSAGRKYYGAHSIIERIRWHVNVETNGDLFKINNNHGACYSRLLMITFPDEFDGFFELRRSPGTIPLV
jgi:hypothetical protein